MNIDNYGQVIVTEDEAVTALYNGKIKDLSEVFLDSEDAITVYNRSVESNADRIPLLKKLDYSKFVDQTVFDELNQQNWFMPETAKEFPLVDWLYDQCKTDYERARVDKELELFVKYEMIDLLFYLKYLVDTMRKNQVLWGVGRGSSVASYVLFLIGVHRIDSIRYNLDIHEFLK